MKFNIVIVGAGQLGSRYLQGLSKCTDLLSIFVMDVNSQALNTAKSRWLDVTEGQSIHNVCFCSDYSLFPEVIDIAIISTASNVREKVIEFLREKYTVRYWILEKVLAQNSEAVTRIEKMIDGNAWVNTNFRMVTMVKEIKPICATGLIHVTVTGGNWGIGCNTIHFVDFVEWWTGENVISFDNSGLDNDWIPAKRNGFWEINGRLTARYSNGSTAAFISDNSNDPLEISIKTPAEEWVIEYEKGIARRNDGFAISGKQVYQSEVTAGLITSILADQDCEIPTLKVSAKQHRLLLDSLLGHWNSFHTEKSLYLPVT